MDDAERRKYYRAGIKACWNCIKPHEPMACVDAWYEYSFDHGPGVPHENVTSLEGVIQFAWGWRWAEDRFKENWLGIPPEKRGVGMEGLWR